MSLTHDEDYGEDGVAGVDGKADSNHDCGNDNDVLIKIHEHDLNHKHDYGHDSVTMTMTITMTATVVAMNMTNNHDYYDNDPKNDKTIAMTIAI